MDKTTVLIVLCAEELTLEPLSGDISIPLHFSQKICREISYEKSPQTLFKQTGDRFSFENLEKRHSFTFFAENLP